MKSLTLLTLQILDEFGCLVCTSTSHDRETIMRRVEHEGVSFLTITLPDFAKDFQKSLEHGKVAISDFTAFRRGKGGWLPAFLQGFTSLVFNPCDGVLLDNPSTEAIRAVRQICLLHQKLLLDCTPGRERKAFRDYLASEDHVKLADQVRTDYQYSRFEKMFSLLFRDVVQPLDNLVYSAEPAFIPKHGPGSTAERTHGNAKFQQKTWPRRLEEVFPQRDYIIPSERHSLVLDDVRDLGPGDEIPVRVISVPKTLKTRRIIAIEPVAMQYMQQSLLSQLVPRLEDDSVVGPMIGFSDQVPNRDLARKGSMTGSLATLDLSSASDLVSNQLVRAAFARWPHFGAAIDATRSRRADVPGHGVIRLAKFASMGSALCFPIEAMVFLTVVMIGIEESTGTPLDRRSISKLRGQVRVYGDDIIVPKDSVHHVIVQLEAYGFKVGLDKSFWNGRFRESCGGDYYAGEDVTAIRCRQPFPTSRGDVAEVLSLVSLRNQCYSHGLWRTTRWLDGVLRKILHFFPDIHPTSAVVGRHTFLPLLEEERVDRHLHHPLVKGYVQRSQPPVCEIDGVAALLKFFLKQGEKPYEEGHLRRSGRPDAVHLKLRWARPF
ncbi:RNA-directed RNA polymerase [ssRNA phage Zoerhiza.4_23]|uniref:RNA-directed RNA polymerase n=2 Tax=Leviviricetes TaxID=2842243 RepID=A0A8S5KY34_9VIRU|nr:RNA-directed RNA polymerase [ssRNA phage Zoerhiza.4_23]QDH88199.1 MAG: RNA-dependent RNA polymerase [Leviviridae sp.]DAD50329.1 TPA_asm: RNA-directed RNA polymerase [ssRNA phage Zoerhiza.4_23]